VQIQRIEEIADQYLAFCANYSRPPPTSSPTAFELGDDVVARAPSPAAGRIGGM
jgi:hypothetical protein